MDYHIYNLNGFINLKTLAPNEMFFYRIRKPDEITISFWVADLSFFSTNGQLIYCTPKNNPACFLPPFETFNCVQWLDNGQYAFFVEYSRSEKVLCILDLKNEICYKKNRGSSGPIESIIEDLQKNQDYSTNRFIENGYNPFEINRNYLDRNYKKNIFKRWHPK